MSKEWIVVEKHDLNSCLERVCVGCENCSGDRTGCVECSGLEILNKEVLPTYHVYTDHKTLYIGADMTTADRVFEQNERDNQGYFQIVYMDVWIYGNITSNICNTEG